MSNGHWIHHCRSTEGSGKHLEGMGFFFIIGGIYMSLVSSYYWPLPQSTVGLSENTTLGYRLENQIIVCRKDLEIT